jgi:porphobilinogen synthase
MVQEVRLHPSDFIAPLFVQEGIAAPTPIASMPGVFRLNLNDLVREARELFELGIRGVALFPVTPCELKTPDGCEALNPDCLVLRAVRAIKAACPGLCVITDVALDPYNSDGHDGLVIRNERGDLVVLNDETIEVLCKQAICHARAGADIVAPSDMMDGRVAAIRRSLDNAGFAEVAIMSYTAKYASAFYGPFRGALDSAPKEGDKKTYQMDPANLIEAVRETKLDESEGADILMVKPAGLYLDVIAKVRDTTVLPVAAYQVSGEYLMLKCAAATGWLDERAIVMESLLAIKRSGASMILTYFAKQAACWLREN